MVLVLSPYWSDPESFLYKKTQNEPKAHGKHDLTILDLCFPTERIPWRTKSCKGCNVIRQLPKVRYGGVLLPSKFRLTESDAMGDGTIWYCPEVLFWYRKVKTILKQTENPICYYPIRKGIKTVEKPSFSAFQRNQYRGERNNVRGYQWLRQLIKVR